MFDIGWTEMLVLGVLVLLVVGPRELPNLLRTMGQYFSTFQRMAGEFRSQLHEISDEFTHTVNQQVQIENLVGTGPLSPTGEPDLFDDQSEDDIESSFIDDEYLDDEERQADNDRKKADE